MAAVAPAAERLHIAHDAPAPTGEAADDEAEGHPEDRVRTGRAVVVHERRDRERTAAGEPAGEDAARAIERGGRPVAPGHGGAGRERGQHPRGTQVGQHGTDRAAGAVRPRPAPQAERRADDEGGGRRLHDVGRGGLRWSGPRGRGTGRGRGHGSIVRRERAPRHRPDGHTASAVRPMPQQPIDRRPQRRRSLPSGHGDPAGRPARRGHPGRRGRRRRHRRAPAAGPRARPDLLRGERPRAAGRPARGRDDPPRPPPAAPGLAARRGRQPRHLLPPQPLARLDVRDRGSGSDAGRLAGHGRGAPASCCSCAGRSGPSSRRLPSPSPSASAPASSRSSEARDDIGYDRLFSRRLRPRLLPGGRGGAVPAMDRPRAPPRPRPRPPGRAARHRPGAPRRRRPPRHRHRRAGPGRAGRVVRAARGRPRRPRPDRGRRSRGPRARCVAW